MTLAEFSLRGMLDHDAVSVIIPGARNPDQVTRNLAAAKQPALSAELEAKLAEFYAAQVAGHIRGSD